MFKCRIILKKYLKTKIERMEKMKKILVFDELNKGSRNFDAETREIRSFHSIEKCFELKMALMHLSLKFSKCFIMLPQMS